MKLPIRPIAALSIALLSLICQSSPTFAEGRAPGSSGGESALSRLYKTIIAEQYADAQTQADELLKSGTTTERKMAALLYGRMLLGQSKTADVLKYLDQMRNLKLENAGDRQYLSIYTAWSMALEGKEKEAIKALQVLIKKGIAAESTADAAEVLGQIYLKTGDKVQAANTLTFGLDLLKSKELKSNYIEPLLKKRLEIAQGKAKEAAEALFLQAEAWRVQKKWTDAGPLFLEVKKQYPNSDWRHAATFRMGECLAEVGSAKEAATLWQAFIREAPNGPWRGQAYAGLIRLALEVNFQRKGAAEQASLALAALQGKLDEKAKPSWDVAASDLQLLAGVVALSERRPIDAARAFEASKKAAQGYTPPKLTDNSPWVPPTPAPPTQSWLNAVTKLAADAQAQQEILPAELLKEAESQSLPLLVATVYNRLERFEQAITLFDKTGAGQAVGPGGKPAANAAKAGSKAHRSFADLGKGTALRGLKQFTPAKKSFQQSLAGFPNGTWHEQTLVELPLLIEQMVTEAEVIPPPAGGQAAPAAQPVKLSETEQAKRLKQAHAEALPHWMHFLLQFRNSAKQPLAHFKVGLFSAEDEKWDQAVQTFGNLIKHYPNSPWTGDAQVWMVDILLERQFDLAVADQHSKLALQWLQQSKGSTPLETQTTPPADGARPLRDIAYDIYIRAGLIAYLGQKFDDAVTQFRTAQKYAPPRTFVVVVGKIATGPERLVSAAEQGKAGHPITPQSILEGPSQVSLVLMLADLYHESQNFNRSIDLTTRVLDSSGSKATGAGWKPTPDQRSWALYKRARSRYAGLADLPRTPPPQPVEQAQTPAVPGLNLPPAMRIAQQQPAKPELTPEQKAIQQILNDYNSANKAAPKAAWSDDALFYAANIYWNHRQDPDNAATLWQKLIKQYPDSNELHRSAYFVGVAFEWSGRHLQAKRAYEESLNNYPDSIFNTLVREHLAKVDVRITEQRQNKKSKRQTEKVPARRNTGKAAASPG